MKQGAGTEIFFYCDVDSGLEVYVTLKTFKAYAMRTDKLLLFRRSGDT